MDLEAAAKELTGSDTSQSVETTPSTDTTPPTTQPTVEEIELMVNGKPFRLPVNTEVPYKHNGQIVKKPFSNILNSVRQDDHLESKKAEYLKMKAEIEKERGDFDTYKSQREKFGAIQDWSEKNPQEWQRLLDLYQKKDLVLGTPEAGQEQVSPKVLEYIGKLEAKIREHDEKWSSFDKQNEETKVREEVGVINREVEEFSKEFPEIDLTEANLDGVTLKGLIMQHGVNNGIRTFKLAAMDFLGPRLMEIAQQRGRTEAVKSVKTDKSQGIVARSDKPFGQGSPVDPGKMSKGDRLNAAKAELESALSR